MNSRRDTRTSMLLLMALATVAGTSLWGSMPSPWLIPLALLGAGVAMTSWLIADRHRLLSAEQLAMSLVMLVIVGGQVAAGGRGLGYGDFLRGLTGGWANILTTIPPLQLTAQYRVLPYVLGWCATALGLLVIRHFGHGPFVMLGPIIVFGFGLLVSPEVTNVALAQGTLILVLSLAYQAILGGASNPSESKSTGMSGGLWRTAMAVAVLLTASATAVGASSWREELLRPRFDAREVLEPPWEPLNVPSPLSSIKANYSEANSDQVAFVVTGRSIPRRWRLATMAHFDGTVWTVGSPASLGRSQFVSIDTLPPSGEGSPHSHETVALQVKVEMQEGPWLPTTGAVRSIVVDSDDRTLLHADTAGPTIAAPDGAAGLSYRLDVIPWVQPSASELRSAAVLTSTDPPPDLQAESVFDFAADTVEGVQQGWPQAEQIAEVLTSGFYHSEQSAPPGHSWSRLSDFVEARQLVGHEEQYAALAGIVGRNANLPVRVVVGYVIDPGQPLSGKVVVTRRSASAWIEVQSKEHGWIPIDVTPDRDQQPTDEPKPGPTISVAETSERPRPQPEEPRDVDQAVQQDLEPPLVEPDPARTRVGLVIGAAAAATGLPLVLIACWLLLMIVLKGSRRRRRRTAKDQKARVLGAWAEIDDRTREQGMRVPNHLTPTERARLLMLVRPELASMETLARRVDEAAFGGSATQDAAGEAAWQLCDEAIDALRAGRSVMRRLLDLSNPSPLHRRQTSRGRSKAS